MPHVNGTGAPKSESGHLSSEVQAAVRSELNQILSAPAFSQSKRCKNFLSYVVEQTVQGHLDQLKERMIGVKVFDRAYDYDTGDDSIVRVTANEVRKRISQFYQEAEGAHPIHIDLPRGSYVPEFRFHMESAGHEADSSAPPPASESAQAVEAPAPERPLADPVSEVPDLPAGPMRAAATETKAARRGGAWRSAGLIVLIGGLAAATATLGILRVRAHREVPQMWDAFANAKTPVLLCMGTHQLPDAGATASPAKEELAELPVSREIIPIGDAAALSSISRALGRRGIPFRILGANETSLAELQGQPVILIGAVDNRWTLQLTQGLRYRISVNVPPGPAESPVGLITDAEEPTRAEWKTDFSVPAKERKTDYAVIAREDDATLGVPVLIVAGLGVDATLAASKLITSDALTPRLESEPGCRGKRNFEAVIGTGQTGTKAAPAAVLRLTCW